MQVRLREDCAELRFIGPHMQLAQFVREHDIHAEDRSSAMAALLDPRLAE